MKRNKLIELRLYYNFTQEGIAENLGISRSHYALIETGHRNPSLDLSLKIAELFNTTVDEIFIATRGDKNN